MHVNFTKAKYYTYTHLRIESNLKEYFSELELVALDKERSVVLK